MRKSRFTESQIVATLKQVEGGRQFEDVCRELGVSEATYSVWKSKYGGMEAGDVHRRTKKAITPAFIDPDRPMQDGFLERFNGSVRRGVLEIHVSSGVQRGILHIWLHTDTQHALQRGTVNVSRCGRIPLGRCSCLDYGNRRQVAILIQCRTVAPRRLNKLLTQPT